MLQFKDSDSLRCNRLRARLRLALLLGLQVGFSSSFLTPVAPALKRHRRSSITRTADCGSGHSSSSSNTALNVWWFGGTETAEEVGQDEDSCELVPVRIERTSPNSRKIFGEIIAPVPIEDVWAILTDYDRLAHHVPNLVESKIVHRPRGSNGEPGDGNYQCRLFQKGAQKIVGFEFGASVTMDMKEYIAESSPTPASKATTASSSAPGSRAAANGRAASIPRTLSPRNNNNNNLKKNSYNNGAMQSVAENPTTTNKERRVSFKCCESFFFSEFDGEWKVVERTDDQGNPECVLSYVVDVRPKGPVPVAALEWRIREDVPTNLRAVKRAAVSEGYEGVLSYRERNSKNGSMSIPLQGLADGIKANVSWERSETMAAYL